MTAAYEALRDAVVDGAARSEGIAALRYHGMLHGLPVLVNSTAPVETALRYSVPRMDTFPAGDEFVRLLANLLLQTHSEIAHVY